MIRRWLRHRAILRNARALNLTRGQARRLANAYVRWPA